jgi:hypothetical protein
MLTVSFLSLTTDAWNSIGTWIAAVGTVGATGMAVRSARQARAIAEQNRADALEVRREETAARRIEQASKVCAWITYHFGSESTVPIKLMNTSDEPVHNLIVYLVWVQGSAPHTGEEMEARARKNEHFNVLDLRTIAQVLPPGEHPLVMNRPHSSPMQGVLGVEIAFTDSANRHWLRRASTGELVSIHNDPVMHYGITRPFPYRNL